MPYLIPEGFQKDGSWLDGYGFSRISPPNALFQIRLEQDKASTPEPIGALSFYLVLKEDALTVSLWIPLLIFKEGVTGPKTRTGALLGLVKPWRAG